MNWQVAADANDLVRGSAQVGDAQITVCTDGTALFDGGAMFGVVPRTLWQRKLPPDDLNRVAIGLNCVVVRLGGKTVLIETGFGNKLTPKLREIYGAQQRLPESLAAAGIAPAEVDIVINTHLHWDHCGWNTMRDDSGDARAFFPHARYIAPAGEVEHGRRQFERDRISYVADNYEPLLANGQMQTIEAAEEQVCTGIRVERFPGHTASMLAVHVESAGEHACFISDLVPTSAHLDLTWCMGFDLDPMRVIEERKRFFARAVAEQWLVLFSHDHALPMTQLGFDDRGRAVPTRP